MKSSRSVPTEVVTVPVEVRLLFFLIIAVVISTDKMMAQNSHSVETTLAAYTGVRNDGQITYHYLEVLQTRGKWILPDVGYIDLAEPGKYREIFFGGGAVLHNSKHLTVVEEGYVNQTTGPASGGALYFMPWTLVSYHPTSKITSETVYFPYLPLNKTGRIQHVLERSKLEYDFPRFKVGAGYGAYRFGDGEWQSKPFVTSTIKAGRVGSVELWLQKMPEHHFQVQVRYVRVFP